MIGIYPEDVIVTFELIYGKDDDTGADISMYGGDMYIELAILSLIETFAEITGSTVSEVLLDLHEFNNDINNINKNNEEKKSVKEILEILTSKREMI